MFVTTEERRLIQEACKRESALAYQRGWVNAVIEVGRIIGNLRVENMEGNLPSYNLLQELVKRIPEAPTQEE